VDIPLGILTATYLTDHGTGLTLVRPYAILGFPDRMGREVRLRCLIDTGAPLSIVPYDVWKHRNLSWTSVSKTLRRQTRKAALDWQGVSCELGHTKVDLFGERSLTAKFALGPTAPIDVILGLNFLVDNDIEIHLLGTSGNLSGRLTLP
jgi:hypothetical protein